MREARSNTYFLGGRDLEMATIAQLLARFAPGRFHDKQLAWGAKTSSYAAEIEAALAVGQTVVLVELDDDAGFSTGPHETQVVLVDHHGTRAGHDQPTSLEQVFAMLGLPETEWTRWMSLVAANDRGHVAAMLNFGATADEIAAVRAADRAAQGITIAEEQQGRQAAADAEAYFQGRLTVVRLPHGRTATVTDALDPALGGPGYQNLLVLCPHSVTFFGQGAAIERLRRAFSGGYFGGELPQRGFWGHGAPAPTLDGLLTQIAFLGDQP